MAALGRMLNVPYYSYPRSAICFGLVYKYIDIVGTSPKGTDYAIKNAIQEASKTVKNIQWAELGRVTVKVDKQTLEY